MKKSSLLKLGANSLPNKIMKKICCQCCHVHDDFCFKTLAWSYFHRSRHLSHSIWNTTITRPFFSVLLIFVLLFKYLFIYIINTHCMFVCLSQLNIWRNQKKIISTAIQYKRLHRDGLKPVNKVINDLFWLCFLVLYSLCFYFDLYKFNLWSNENKWI